MWAVEKLFIIEQSVISRIPNSVFLGALNLELPLIMTSGFRGKKIVSESKLHVRFGICAIPSQMLAGTGRLGFHSYEQPTFACFLYLFLLKIPLEMVEMTLKLFANGLARN